MNILIIAVNSSFSLSVAMHVGFCWYCYHLKRNLTLLSIWQGIRMLAQTASKVHMAGQLLLKLDQIKALSHNGRVAVGSEFLTISRNSNQVQPMVSSKTSIRLSCCQLIFFPFGCHACRFLLVLLPPEKKSDTFVSWEAKPIWQGIRMLAQTASKVHMAGQLLLKLDQIKALSTTPCAAARQDASAWRKEGGIGRNTCFCCWVNPQTW